MHQKLTNKMELQKAQNFGGFVALVLALTLLRVGYAYKFDHCILPEHWHGPWLIAEHEKSPHISINSTSIEGEGQCEYSSTSSTPEDKYYIFSQEEGTKTCRSCYLISEKHLNVLRYRKSPISDCQKKNDWETLCDGIGADLDYHSLYQTQAKKRQECPFQRGKYRVSYRRNDQLCENPRSEMYFCVDDAAFVIQYDACADMQGSERTQSEIHCLAEWEEGPNKFIIGKLKGRHREEDIFRCFSFRTNNQFLGYNISKSGTASCDGLTETEHGEEELMLLKDPLEKTCAFPKWLATNWTFLNNGTQTINFDETNNDIMIERIVMFNDTGNYTFQQLFICREIVEESQNHVNITGEYLFACNRYKDVSRTFHRITENIMQFGVNTRVYQFGPDNVLQTQRERHKVYVRQDKLKNKMGNCPLNRQKYTVKTVIMDGHLMLTSCINRGGMIFWSDKMSNKLKLYCKENEDDILEDLTCRTSWTKNEFTYFLASYKSDHSLMYRCFKMTKLNGSREQSWEVVSSVGNCDNIFNSKVSQLLNDTWKFILDPIDTLHLSSDESSPVLITSPSSGTILGSHSHMAIIYPLFLLIKIWDCLLNR